MIKVMEVLKDRNTRPAHFDHTYYLLTCTVKFTLTSYFRQKKPKKKKKNSFDTHFKQSETKKNDSFDQKICLEWTY